TLNVTHSPSFPHTLQLCAHPLSFTFFFSSPPRPPRSTLFPYTTLFRSGAARALGARRPRRGRVAAPGRAARRLRPPRLPRQGGRDRKSTRLNSSHLGISYAVFCLKKKKNHTRSRSISRPIMRQR